MACRLPISTNKEEEEEESLSEKSLLIRFDIDRLVDFLSQKIEDKKKHKECNIILHCNPYKRILLDPFIRYINIFLFQLFPYLKGHSLVTCYLKSKLKVHKILVKP